MRTILLSRPKYVFFIAPLAVFRRPALNIGTWLAIESGVTTLC